MIAAQQGMMGDHGEIAIAKTSGRNATEMTYVREGKSLTGAHDTENVSGMRGPRCRAGDRVPSRGRARGPRHVAVASRAPGKGKLAMTIEIGKSGDE